jgi:hypothetical protein
MVIRAMSPEQLIKYSKPPYVVGYFFDKEAEVQKDYIPKAVRLQYKLSHILTQAV